MLSLSLSRYTVVNQFVAGFVSPTWHNRHTALKDSATRDTWYYWESMCQGYSAVSDVFCSRELDGSRHSVNHHGTC
jgi:hypothetical protein